MVNEKEVSGGLEWRVKGADGSSEILVPESGVVRRIQLALVGFVLGFVWKVWRFLKKARDVGVDDPRKVIHCLKVGMALTVVSLVYYMRPLYQGVGGNAMWAVLTVVVVFEHNVGATLYKSLNRVTGTFLAGALGMGIHWVASQSGEKLEPVIVRISVFLFAVAATFSRFIPAVKTRFDYGAMIFILTFSLVSVAGYRVHNLFKLAHQRLSTVAIGGFMCILISVLICPIWAGQDLHLLIARNMEKLANSLDACVAEYLNEGASVIDNNEELRKKVQGYKCVLNSKAAEESLANFARWEPTHGRYRFQHPWKHYLKVGTAMRNCAYYIEALNGCIISENQAPEFIKKHLSNVCMRLSSHSSTVLKELAICTKSMRKSSTIYFSIGEMNSDVQDLQNALKFLPTKLSPPQLPTVEVPVKAKPNLISTTAVPLIDVLPLVTVASLLIEITTRIEEIVYVVDELAGLADFKPADDSKPKQNRPTNNLSSDHQEQETMKVLQQV